MISISTSLVAVAVALSLSPWSLAVLGNQMGRAGAEYLYAVAFAIFLHGLTAQSLGKARELFPGADSEGRLLKSALGPVLAVALAVPGRVVFVICAATALLATAGYTFNEVFLYWFPNLGFSFLLLASLVAVSLAPERFWCLSQIAFVGIVLAGLSGLIIAGFILTSNVASFGQISLESFHWTEIAVSAVMLFFAFDLAGFVARKDGRPQLAVNSMIAGLMLNGVVLSLWGLISLMHVGSEKLADTTIPHILFARAILRDTGRWWMGAVVIGGVCAAVNAMLRGTSKMIVEMAEAGLLLPSILQLSGREGSLLVVLIALATASMMGLGMAGELALEVYLSGGIWLWLLNHAALHLSLLVMTFRGPFGPQGVYVTGRSGVGLAGLMFVLAGLLWHASDRAIQIQFLLWVLAAGLILGLVFARVSRSLHAKDAKTAKSEGNF